MTCFCPNVNVSPTTLAVTEPQKRGRQDVSGRYVVFNKAVSISCYAHQLFIKWSKRLLQASVQTLMQVTNLYLHVDGDKL